MASSKEIRQQIRGVRNTQTITRAMEMVAASKMRQAQLRMEGPRPYAEALRSLVARLAHSVSCDHPFFQTRPCRSVGVLLITSDRGLCGGLNANLFRFLLTQLRSYPTDRAPAMGLIGAKGIAWCRNMPVDVLAQTSHLGDKPALLDIVGVVHTLVSAYTEGRLDALYLVHNRFVNTMQQDPVCEPLLPVPVASDLADPRESMCEPDLHTLLDQVLPRFLESQVYQGVVEHMACEQAARMVAMKAASDNASELIGDLQLAYNKARQAAITQELSEIVSGAAAVA